MLRLFQIGDDAADFNPCSNAGFKTLVGVIKHGVMPIIQIGIPIILIVLGTIDLGKAVISSDEKEVKQAQSRLFKRCIYAVAIFFVVTLVQLIMSLVADTAASVGSDDAESADIKKANTWWECWRAA